jgi:Sec-independent protein secretion pathway component TatC
VITPGADPFTPTLLAIPLLLLYEASIIVLQRIFRR